MSLFRPFMLITASLLLASCAGTSPDANKPKVRKSLSEQLQDNLAASIATFPLRSWETAPERSRPPS